MTLHKSPPSGAEAWAHELLTGARGLTANQLRVLESLVRAFRVPVDITGIDDSDVVDTTFAEAMADLLTLHHALHEAPLNKRAFEYVMKQCLMAQGHHAELNPTPGDSAWDVTGAGARWSLKTEAAKGISRNVVRVEKFMEARWIRECTSPARCAAEVRARAGRHMDDYDRILVLRAFLGHGAVTYKLEEIPKLILVECFAKAATDMFAKRRKALSYGAIFHRSVDGTDARMFRILLDSSVEKIRLWFESVHCIHHGSWRVRVAETQNVQQQVVQQLSMS